MAQLISTYLGSGATINNTDPSNPILEVPLINFQDAGLDIPLVDPTKGDSILAAMIKKLEETTTGKAEDPTYGVIIEPPFSKEFVARGSSDQISHPYSFRIYQPDPTTGLDPDEVV